MMKLQNDITMDLVAVMNKIERRYIVLDEEQQPIRKFYTKADAIRFLLDGWTVITLPKTPIIDWNNYEPALF